MTLNQENLSALGVRIISHTHRSTRAELASEVDEYTSRVIENYNKSNGTERLEMSDGLRMLCEAITYMRHNGQSLIMKLRKAEMQVLIEKATAYSTGELEPHNDGVFNCGASGVFANENDVDEEYAENRKAADLYRALDEYSKRR